MTCQVSILMPMLPLCEVQHRMSSSNWTDNDRWWAACMAVNRLLTCGWRRLPVMWRQLSMCWNREHLPLQLLHKRVSSRILVPCRFNKKKKKIDVQNQLYASLHHGSLHLKSVHRENLREGERESFPFIIYLQTAFLFKVVCISKWEWRQELGRKHG